MTRDDLLARIAEHWPQFDLDQRDIRWTEIETGIALMVDE